MRGIPENKINEWIEDVNGRGLDNTWWIEGELLEYIEELQEPWIPIETARKDGTRYLLFNIFWEAPCTGLFDGRQWVLHSDLPPFKNQPTHYQELPIHKPEPPR